MTKNIDLAVIKTVLLKDVNAGLVLPGKANEALYELAINSWLNYCEDLGADTEILELHMKHNGLINTISLCVNTASAIKSDAVSTSMSKELLAYFKLPLDKALPALSYLKRFNPERQVDFSLFINRNKNNRFKQPNSYVTSGLSLIIKHILAGFDKKSLNPLSGFVPNGATYYNKRHSSREVKKQEIDSNLAYEGFYHDTFHTIPKRDLRCARLTSVPKSYKTPRFILVMPGYLNSAVYNLDVELRRILKDNGIDLSTQEVNRDLALNGSSSGLYDTLDLSGGSDGCSWSLLSEILPDDIYNYLVRWSCRFYEIGSSRDGIERFMHNNVPIPMGWRCTFSILTLIMLACLHLANSFFLGMPVREYISNWPTPPGSIYGDDVICYHHLSEILVDILESIGFEVNSDKSFTSDSNRYRESCGLEAFWGSEVSFLYFPKAEFQQKPEYHLSVIAHQHNACEKGLTHLSDYLTTWLTRIRKFSFVPLGSDCNYSIWTRFAALLGQKYYSPYATFDHVTKDGHKLTKCRKPLRDYMLGACYDKEVVWAYTKYEPDDDETELVKAVVNGPDGYVGHNYNQPQIFGSDQEYCYYRSLEWLENHQSPWDIYPRATSGGVSRSIVFESIVE